MTSFELFELLKFNFKKIYILYIYFYALFLLNNIMRGKLHHFMKHFEYFASNYGIITGIKIKLCKKSCRKEKLGGA